MKAYCVLIAEGMEHAGELRAHGNGVQFQFPIFASVKEAKSWRAESEYSRGKIVPCTITITGGRTTSLRAATPERHKTD